MVVCSAFLIPLKNTYSSHCSLFVFSKVILSHMTQDDSLAMAMYRITLLPFVKLLENTDTVQEKYPNDGNPVGKLRDFHRRQESPREHGPAFEYQCQNTTKKNHIEGHQYIETPSSTRIGNASASHDFE